MTINVGDVDPGGRRGTVGVVRDRKCNVVTRLLRAAQTGRGGVLLVEGPSGIGKSRLLAKATDAAAGCGFMIARGRADELRGWFRWRH